MFEGQGEGKGAQMREQAAGPVSAHLRVANSWIRWPVPNTPATRDHVGKAGAGEWAKLQEGFAREAGLLAALTPILPFL